MDEAPLILLEALLAKGANDGLAEGLRIARHRGVLVVQVALTAERLRTFSWERPCSFQLPPEAAVRLAHDLLRQFAPEVAEALERLATSAQLRVIEGGLGGDAA